MITPEESVSAMVEEVISRGVGFSLSRITCGLCGIMPAAAQADIIFI
jgi:hypothetical protein